MRIISVLMTSLLYLFSAVVAAEEIPRFAVKNLRALGMGGSAVAVAGEDNVFFYNPALLSTVKYLRCNLIDLGLRFNTNALGQYQFYRDHQEQLENINNLADDELNDLYDQALAEAQKQAVLNFEGPLSLQLLARPVGVGLFSRAHISYEIFAGATGLPIVDARVRGEAQAMAAFAHSFKAGPRGIAGDLAVGVSAKYSRRWITRKTKTISSFSSNEALHVYSSNNFGIDVGVFYPLNKKWQFGAAWYDAFSTPLQWNTRGATLDNPAPPDKIEPSFRLGTVFRPGWRMQKWLYNVAIAFDVDQPFDGDITFFKKLYMGTEVNLTPILMLRGGFGQGYPAVGGGLNLYVVRADYVFYGEELGKYAGQAPSWNHAFRLQVGF